MWVSAPTINRVQVVKRHVSSKTPQRSLPPAKMRALISLYHQSESFITPENLSARIDQAFLGQESLARVASPNATLTDLRRIIQKRKENPRMGVWGDDRYLSQRPEQMAPGWSGGFSFREQSVMNALYGVDQGGKPGLEVLEESAERIQQDLEDDMMDGEGESES
jgi:hypothetical protein